MDLLFCNSFLQHHPTPLAGHRQEKTEKKHVSEGWHRAFLCSKQKPIDIICKWVYFMDKTFTNYRRGSARVPCMVCLKANCLTICGRKVYFCLYRHLGQFTRNYTQTVKRAADNKRRYAPGWVHSTCLLRGFPKGAAPHLAHDFAEQSVVCYTLCRRCPENTVAAGEGKGI